MERSLEKREAVQVRGTQNNFLLLKLRELSCRFVKSHALRSGGCLCCAGAVASAYEPGKTSAFRMRGCLMKSECLFVARGKGESGNEVRE